MNGPNGCVKGDLAFCILKIEKARLSSVENCLGRQMAHFAICSLLWAEMAQAFKLYISLGGLDLG